jgi:hypothetical protein
VFPKNELPQSAKLDPQFKMFLTAKAKSRRRKKKNKENPRILSLFRLIRRVR